MPKEFGVERLAIILTGIRMAVFTKAKTGTIIKATGLCKSVAVCKIHSHHRFH